MDPKTEERLVRALRDAGMPTDEIDAFLSEVSRENLSAEQLERRLEQEMQNTAALRSALKEAMMPPAVSDAEWNDVILGAVSTHGQRLGWVLIVPSVAAATIGAAVGFFTSDDIPIGVRIVSGVLAAGVSFLFLAAIADRLSARRKERYGRIHR